MKRRNISVLLMLIVFGTVSFAKTLTVAAASDLTGAFREIGEVYKTEENIDINFIFSSSGILKEQILNGAPYDVYASANIKFVDELIDKEYAYKETKEIYGIGKIVLAQLSDSKVKIIEINDLLKEKYKKIAIANPEHAPYGAAAKEALVSAGIWEKIKDKLVYGKDIQDTASYIRTGNADAGFIALSIADKRYFSYINIDSKSYKPLYQAMAVLKVSKSKNEANSFIKKVNSPEGRIIMKKYGFILPDEDK